MEFLLFFLPLFLVIYGLTPKNARNVTLLSGSLVFYALGEPKYLLLLMISVLVNYFFGLHLERNVKKEDKDKKHKKKRNKKQNIVLALALLFNVGLLALFKSGVGGAGLPLGISFYTFQILSYLLDVYRGEQKRERSFLMLASYITMFPQLLSGPIVNYGEIRESLRERPFTAAGVQEGLKLFTMGLASKVLLADRLAILWNDLQMIGFQSISTPLAWFGAAGYSLQLYFDFWGYSLMASGVMVMLGFEFIPNFNHPYAAKSISEFYRRWHVTLGSWFRDYVYIPLGGSRCSKSRLAMNLAIVWLLTGIWHGNGLNYLIWGAVLGLFIILEKLVYGKYLQKAPVAGNLYVLLLIPLTWVTFAVTDLKKLGIYFGRLFPMIGGAGIAVNQQDIFRYAENYGIYFIAGIALCIPAVYELFEKHKRNPIVILLLAAVFWASVYLLCSSAGNPFMYLKF